MRRRPILAVVAYLPFCEATICLNVHKRADGGHWSSRNGRASEGRARIDPDMLAPAAPR